MNDTQKRRADYRENPQEGAIVQASFLHMADLEQWGLGPPGSGRRRVAKRVDLSLRQMTFADIDEAWL